MSAVVTSRKTSRLLMWFSVILTLLLAGPLLTLAFGRVSVHSQGGTQLVFEFETGSRGR